MQRIIERLGRIDLKLKQLASELISLRTENSGLLDENKNLKDNLLIHHNRIKDLEHKLANTRQMLEQKRENDPESSKKLRKDLEQYIKEVDKCIEWLQNS
ncbi:MAG: hypothetical protein AAGG75_17030 [Bacteroidota bacterium]